MPPSATSNVLGLKKTKLQQFSVECAVHWQKRTKLWQLLHLQEAKRYSSCFVFKYRYTWSSLVLCLSCGKYFHLYRIWCDFDRESSL